MPKDKRVTLCDQAISGIHNFMALYPDVKRESDAINIICVAGQRNDICVSIKDNYLATKGKLYQVPVDPEQ